MIFPASFEFFRQQRDMHVLFLFFASEPPEKLKIIPIRSLATKWRRLYSLTFKQRHPNWKLISSFYVTFDDVWNCIQQSTAENNNVQEKFGLDLLYDTFIEQMGRKRSETFEKSIRVMAILTYLAVLVGHPVGEHVHLLLRSLRERQVERFCTLQTIGTHKSATNLSSFPPPPHHQQRAIYRHGFFRSRANSDDSKKRVSSLLMCWCSML